FDTGDFRLRDATARRGRPALRRLDVAPAGDSRLHRTRAWIPIPARQGQLDRGRNLGDSAQRDRRTGARPATRTPCRQGHRLEGPAPMSTGHLLYTDTEDALRDSVPRLLADRCKRHSVTTLYDQPDVDFTDVWKTLAVELGLAGLLVPESLRAAGARTRQTARGIGEMR